MDKRTVIAYVLIGALMFYFLVRMQEHSRKAQAYRKAVEQEKLDQAPDNIDEAEPDEKDIVAEKSTGTAFQPASVEPLDDAIPIGGDDLKYNLTWTNKGGSLQQARLKDHKEEMDSERGVLLLESVAGKTATLALRDPDGEYPFDTQHYTHAEGKGGSLVFTADFPDGLQVNKEFIPRPGKSELGVKITFTNNNQKNQSIFARYEIVAIGRIVPGSGGRGMMLLNGACGYQDITGKVILQKIVPRKRTSGARRLWPGNWKNSNKLPYYRQSNEEERIVWAGASNRYFAAVLQAAESKDVPAQDLVHKMDVRLLEGSEPAASARGRPMDNLYITLTPHAKELAPGESITHEYTLFLGAKEQKVLAAYPDLQDLLDYGMFGAISRLLLFLLQFFYRVIPNYGVCIILLTILVKAVLHPFSRKSQIAMRKMQKLQPLIREIQEKHKGDRQKQGQAQMELMRKHGANPMSGCWPIFLQLPVFFGLFRMLQYSVLLRHQGFIFWIYDLSQPDTLTTIIVAGREWSVNILPVLMVISWVTQSLLQPKSPDPQQAQTQKMMVFMPIMFGFFLYSMASGLTLYWLTSTFIGIFEQKWIKHKLAQMEDAGAFAAEEAEVAEAKTPRRRPRRK